MNEEPRRADELLLDELTEQLDRTRRLLTGSPGDAAERALSHIGGASTADARLTAQLAVARPLAAPERFGEAHRLVMRSLEVLERDGHRDPPVRLFGPLRGPARALVELVAKYVVRSFTRGIVGDLGTLYAQRESQSEPGSPERRLLAAARAEVERLEPRYSGGGLGAPLIFLAGALVPALASVAQQAGAIRVDARIVVPAAVVPLLLFVVLSWALLRGAAVARHRSRLVIGRPLAALWETVGQAGEPPEDGAALIATVAIVLAALVWFALPALIVLGVVVF